MIVCRKCSRQHPDGVQFCVCGAFLEFDGDHVPDPPAVTASEGGASVKTEAATPTSPTPTGRRGGASTSEPAPWSGFAGQAEDDSIGARRPGVPTDTPTTEPLPPGPTIRPGDVVCRSCGTPNTPDRHHCRHCGLPVTGVATGDQPAARDSWWRRLSGRARATSRGRRGRSAVATARRMSRRGLSGRSMAFRGGSVVVVVAGVLAFLGPWRHQVIAKAQELAGASRHVVVDDVDVETAPASASIVPLDFPLQPAEHVLDRLINTAWATRWVEPDELGLEAVPADGACVDEIGSDSVLRFTFGEPTDLARIRILGGRFAGDPVRVALSRPRIIELKQGDVCTHLQLADDGELAIHDIDHDGAREIELRILGRYADEGTAPTVEISEVAFDRRR